MSKGTEKIQDVFAKRTTKESEKAKNTKKNEVKDLTPFVAKFTQKKLDDWKSEFGNRELIFLKVDNFLAVLRPPLADDLGDYLTAIGSNGMAKAVAMIVDQLWLDGDYQLIEEEDLFIAVFLQMNNILEGKKGEFFRA